MDAEARHQQEHEGKTAHVQEQEPGLPPWESVLREGFYESAYGLLERSTAAAFDEIGHLRAALANERADREELLGQLAEWRALAFRYGTETQAEKRLRVGTLFGKVEIAREIVMRSDGEAITHACVSLAKKLRAALKHPERASVPVVEKAATPPTSRSNPDSALTSTETPDVG